VVIELAPALAPAAAARIRRAFGVLEAALGRRHPPGAAAAVVDRTGVRAQAWGGWAKIPPGGIAVDQDTIFDLASLTKVMVTVPLALRWRQERRWSLDDPVARWVPGYPFPAITLRHCLTHVSGLPAHRPFHASAEGIAAVRRALFQVRPEAPPGARVFYSDLNFILLGWAVARCGGAPLARLARQQVFAPLGMRATRYRPPIRWRPRIAAAERDGAERQQRGLIWGDVHDGNARALGGVSGHAGLFAPLGDLVQFVRPLLSPQRHPVLTPASIAAMSRRQAGQPPDVRGFGWRLPPLEMLAGWPPDTYSHTGFTGTSIVVSPAAGLAVVLLSNAVHPKRRAGGITVLRAAFHQALAPTLAQDVP
jgi:CubicO group peptidase (beta-lactamase class C family)